MTVLITDNRSCIRLELNGTVINLPKSAIRSIETLAGDMLRIDYGAGMFRDYYFRLRDVAQPADLDSVEDLREAVKAMLDTWPDAGTILPPGGMSDSVPQDILKYIAAQLRQDAKLISLYRSKGDLPTYTDNNRDGWVYTGFGLIDAQPEDSSWSISRSRSGEDGESLIEWVDGVQAYQYVWADHLDYDYFPLEK